MFPQRTGKVFAKFGRSFGLFTHVVFSHETRLTKYGDQENFVHSESTKGWFGVRAVYRIEMPGGVWDRRVGRVVIFVLKKSKTIESNVV